MEHYFCEGECGGISTEPGTCQAVDCSSHGQELVACNCESGDHVKSVPTENGEDEE